MINIRQAREEKIKAVMEYMQDTLDKNVNLKRNGQKARKRNAKGMIKACK